MSYINYINYIDEINNGTKAVPIKIKKAVKRHLTMLHNSKKKAIRIISIQNGLTSIYNSSNS